MRRSILRFAAPPATILAVIVIGALLRSSAPLAPRGEQLWTIGLWVIGAGITWRTLVQASAGHFATDVVATLAIVTAVIMRQPLAGLIVALMQTGGEALEDYARGRATRALHALENAAPRLAHRMMGGMVADITVDAIVPGDHLLVRPGELIPCDGVIVDGESHLDTSRLTGEALPVRISKGSSVSSGATNLEGSVTLRATAMAADSQYARIVELVRTAQTSKAPLQRLADRYAVWFTPITLLTCAVAWAVSGDPLRVLAVLVVATPCPLILAAPVAIIGGVNAAARRQVIVRTGGALEALARTTAAIFDKTGTLTIGKPHVSRIVPAPGFDEADLLRLAGAVEQASGHLLARTVVEAVESRAMTLPSSHVVEVPGRGVVGDVEGRAVLVGAQSFLLERFPGAAGGVAALEADTTGLRAWIAVDGAAAGVIEYADALRPGARATVARLRALGVTRLLIRSGDTASNTHAIASAVGIDDARGDLLPEDKVRAVQELLSRGERVAMIGDGTNDAPALGTATVGIALAGHGGGISAEAADVVVLADDLERVVAAIHISRHTLRIARQSIWVGLGLSGVAMAFAAAGMIPPVTGALLQEAIDIAVILNALRASRPPEVPDAHTSLNGAPGPERHSGLAFERGADDTPNSRVGQRLEPAATDHP